MSWSAKYVGTYGLTCWGLVAEVYADELGVDLPRYNGHRMSIDEQAEVAALIEGERLQSRWKEVPAAKALPLDVMLFRRGRYPSHVGLWVAPGQMLHVDQDGQARLARFDGIVWGTRLVAVYRHLKRS